MSLIQRSWLELKCLFIGTYIPGVQGKPLHTIAVYHVYSAAAMAKGMLVNSSSNRCLILTIRKTEHDIDTGTSFLLGVEGSVSIGIFLLCTVSDANNKDVINLTRLCSEEETLRDLGVSLYGFYCPWYMDSCFYMAICATVIYCRGGHQIKPHLMQNVHMAVICHTTAVHQKVLGICNIHRGLRNGSGNWDFY